MKIRYLLLLVCLLAALVCASAEEAAQEPVTLITPEGLTVTHVIGDDGFSDAELLIQHCYADGAYETAFILNSELSGLGDADAMYRLGCQHLSGLGTAQDADAALECFTGSSRMGCSEAALALHLARLNGWGMQQDVLTAVADLTAEAQEGRFQDAAALIFLHGAYDVPAHMATALHWFNQLHESLLAQDPAAYEAELTAFLASDPALLTTPPSVQLTGWQEPAVQAQMSLQLGQFWLEGRGGLTDAQAAARWYEHAASFDGTPWAAQAHTALAQLYLEGTLGTVDAPRAIGHLLQDPTRRAENAFRAGQMYWDGLTGEDGTVHLAQDRQTALPLLTESAEAGYAPACLLLGNAYRTGTDVAADPARAAHFYALGLVDTDDTACYDPLLAMYQQGLLYDRSVMDEVYQGLQRWIGTDHQLAMLLADHWLNGVAAQDGTVLVQQDRRAAFLLMDHYRNEHARLHQAPEVYFLNWLGWFYSGNAPEIVARDYAKARACYVESAQAGNGYAMAMVGVFYQNGRGVSVDHMTARKWYKAAIGAGYAAAQGYLDALNGQYPEYPVDLAVTIVTPQGLSLSHTVNASDRQTRSDAELLAAACALEGLWAEAAEINRQLAELGDVDAMYRLGAHYASGLGLSNDDAMAIQWLRKSADAGCSDAVFALACMYLNGWGVTQDAVRAAAMLDVTNGTDELSFLLATLYKNGYANLPADPDAARRCYDAAVAVSLQVISDYADAPGPMTDMAQSRYDAYHTAFEASTALDPRLLTRPRPMMLDWTKSPGTVCAEIAAFWESGRSAPVDCAAAVRWYENALRLEPGNDTVCRPLARLLCDGSAGYWDVQRAIALLCRVRAYEEVAAMFDAGVTATDGRICLAPNDIVAQAFHTLSDNPGDPDASARLGDLFRDGVIVSADPDLAAAFYAGAPDSPYCAGQLAALTGNDPETDPAPQETQETADE